MRALPEVLLASASPRRRELLSSLGFRVIVAPSDVDESDRPGYAPRELAQLLAAAKADAAAARNGDHVILAADTVVDLDGRSLGKPRDAAEAAEMLELLAGRDHVVHTAFTLIDGASGDRLEHVESTRVRFRPLEPAEIAEYVTTGDPLDKAGAYGIQGRGAALVERIDGDFYTVMGLPLGAVVRGLRTLGYGLPEHRA